MTWIKTIPPQQADEKLREAYRWRALYPPEYGASVPSLREVEKNGGNISSSHSLLPDPLYHAFALLGTLLAPDLPLSRTQQEMIATTVSVINHCYY